MSDKRTASQRIEDLERALMSAYQTMDNMARDLMTAKDAIKLLGNKMDAIVKLTVAGEGLSDDTIARVMVENNAAELAERVASLVAQGVLAAEEAITESSFVVGREVREDGTIANPRIQFAMQALAPELKEKLKGGKAGETITLQEGKLKFQVIESYAVQTPTPAPAPEVSEESQASEQASS